MSDGAPPSLPPAPPLAKRLSVLAALAGVFTAILVHYSVLHGRLAGLPTYDDVTYLADGARRLQEVYESGSGAFFRTWRDAPPHAPLWTLFTMGIFALLGIHDWVPYAANALVVLLLLVYADVFARGLALAGRVILALFTLSLPVASMCVLEYRPDCTCAILTALGVVSCLDKDLTSSWRRPAMVGVAFGIAALVKPAIAFLTFGLLGVTLVGSWLCDGGGPRRAPSRPWLRAAGMCIASAVLIALPHFALTFHYYVEYFKLAIFARARPVAPLEGSLAAQLQYFIDGVGGRETIGPRLPLALLVAWTLVGAARRPGPSVRVLALLLVALAAYVVPTLSPVKTPFFGLVMALLVVGLALWGLRDLLGTSPTPSWSRARIAAGVALAAWSVCLFQWPRYWGDRGDAERAYRRRNAESILDAVSATDKHDPEVFFTFTGLISPQLISYMSVQRLGRPVNAFNYGFSDDPKLYKKAMEKADFVVTADPRVPELAPLLNVKIQDELMRWLRARPDYACAARFPAASGPAYYVFRHAAAFEGWRPGPGLTPREGPYPQWDLPEVHWAMAPDASISAVATRTGDYELLMQGWAAAPDLMLRVLIDGTPVAEHRFGEQARFERVRVDVTLQAGEHEITLHTDPGKNSLDGGRAILIRQLRVRWAGPDVCTPPAPVAEPVPAQDKAVAPEP